MKAKKKITLTEAIVRNSKPDSGSTCDRTLWDQRTIGFGLRIYLSGRKAYVVSYHFKGRQRLEVLGLPGELSLADARHRAAKCRANARDEIDPTKSKRRHKESPTVSELYPRFVQAHLSKLKTFKKSQGRFERMLLPHFGKYKLTEVTTRQVVEFFEEKANTSPTLANRLLELLHGLFVYALRHEYVLKNPVKWARASESHRTRTLDKIELQRLLNILGQYRLLDLETACYFVLCLLTACRKNELRIRSWDQVDFENKRILVPEGKSGTNYALTLGSHAENILRKMKQNARSNFLFPSKENCLKPMSDSALNRAWQKIRILAQIPDVRIHDLRRTHATAQINLGTDTYSTGKLLNQSDAASLKPYISVDRARLVQLANHFGDYICDSIPKELLEAA